MTGGDTRRAGADDHDVEIRSVSHGNPDPFASS
jgi:hypothetical protein